jgi:hypothetical protein
VEQSDGGLVFQANFDFDRVDLVSIDVCAIFVE